MESKQYEIMATAEDAHWWYLGLRDAMLRCLQHASVNLTDHPTVLDAGCGTGANLRCLAQALKPSYLAGFDISEQAVEHARRKCPQAQVFISDICEPKLPRQGFDLIISCDVLYVPGLAAARSGLDALVQSLVPGGWLLLHLPAYQWMISAHDRAVHTRERYVVSHIRGLLDALGLHCRLGSYRVCGLLPLIVLRRLPSIINKSPSPRASSDLTQPPDWLNRWLLTTLRLENRLIAHGYRLPWGSSIIALGQKPTSC
jgi:SAM-dependent methyltransferase